MKRARRELAAVIDFDIERDAVAFVEAGHAGFAAVNIQPHQD